MKKKKNAFTLIELLAIIVILAIIAVITVPIILNIIENSRKGAATDSAYGYKDSINKAYLEKLSEQPNYNLGTSYEIQNDASIKNTELATDILSINISGQKPKSGWVVLSSTTHSIDSACMIIGDYKVSFKDGKIKDTVKGNSCPNPGDDIDWDSIFASATKHPEQTLTDDIGIDKYGNVVNLDYWIDYENNRGYGQYTENNNLYIGGSSYYDENACDYGCDVSGLSNVSENGSLKTNIPQYIKSSIFSNSNQFYPVTTVEEYAFNGLSLNTMPELPSTITSIQSSAFMNNNLTTIILPEGLTEIKDAAFRENSIADLTIPSTVTTIGDDAFEDSLNNTKVIILSNEATIGFGAFGYMSDNSISELTIAVENIPSDTFSSRGIGKLTLLDGVTTIGEGAFEDNNITKLILPEGVTTIEDSAFKYNNISELTISSSVTTIGDEAFFSSLSNAKLTILSRTLTIGDNVFDSGTISELTIGLENIPYELFSARDISKLTLLDGVMVIGESAFSNNDISELTIPSSVTTIGDFAFSSNANLTSITVKGKTADTIPSTWDSNWNSDGNGGTYTVTYDN